MPDLTTSEIVLKLASQMEADGAVDFERTLKLWAAERQPDLLPALERFIADSASGINSASAMLLLMALSFEAGQATQVAMLALASKGVNLGPTRKKPKA